MKTRSKRRSAFRHTFGLSHCLPSAIAKEKTNVSPDASPCSARYLPRSGGIRFRSLAAARGAISTDFEPRYDDVEATIPLYLLFQRFESLADKLSNFPAS